MFHRLETSLLPLLTNYHPVQVVTSLLHPLQHFEMMTVLILAMLAGWMELQIVKVVELGRCQLQIL